MCFNIVRFVVSLDGLLDERAKGVCTHEVPLEKGGTKDYLHAIEEDPAKEESSYLAAGIWVRSERRSLGWRDKPTDTHKSGSFKNSSEDGFSRPRIFQAMKVYLANDPRN